MARPRRIKRILNCVPSRETERDWSLATATGAALLAAAPAIPASKDLRAAWWTIGDQGGTGSCVGWASADSVLRWHFVKAKRLKTDQRLSPRFLWMASKETDPFTSQPTTFIEAAGTSIKTALDVARKYGTVLEPVLAFDSARLYAGDERTFYALAAQLKISSYFNLSLGWAHRLADWRAWIATTGPILTRLSVDRTWDDAAATKGELERYLPKTARGGHAVAIVGYTPDHFIVRNSWGTKWGDKGFAYATDSYAEDAFTEAYGVMV